MKKIILFHKLAIVLCLLTAVLAGMVITHLSQPKKYLECSLMTPLFTIPIEYIK
jgi:hypothetical protein